MKRPLALTIPAVTVCSRPKGLPDGEHPAADLERLGVPHLQRGKVLGAFDLDQRQVGLGVAADDLGVELPFVGQPDLDLVGVLDHVVVGDDEPVRVDDEARPQAALLELPARAALAEGLAVGLAVAERVAEEVPEDRPALLGGFHGADVDHPGLHLLGQRRKIGQHHLVARVGRVGVLGLGAGLEAVAQDRDGQEHGGDRSRRSAEALSHGSPSFEFFL